ncbi:hypothetical protein MSG28_000808 [Choristoneura fumiferana]|uniref:Uncharacterized protein n=1 Tax=Choristoneura fumiferana TaxID=7141 RepID=A0ACC0K2W3_CHOFU|nr:hypothetical protein MSG28_000808 [Choristoneura fumiferana]
MAMDWTHDARQKREMDQGNNGVSMKSVPQHEPAGVIRVIEDQYKYTYKLSDVLILNLSYMRSIELNMECGSRKYPLVDEHLSKSVSLTCLSNTDNKVTNELSSKAKEKTHKHSQIKLKKSSIDNSSNSNQYENPRSVKDAPSTNHDVGRIYENLAVGQFRSEFNSSTNNISSSNHSSSSTLVSESIKKCQNGNLPLTPMHDDTARPQVPRKPNNELPTTRNLNQNETSPTNHYPDVYYHSVEKLTERILVSPVDEIEIHRAVESYAKPASVGAEIKKVSTKFLISPKKEAEVRTIQPIRARSFSFDNNNKNKCIRDSSLDKHNNNSVEKVKKSYNYSAPTSPIPTNHKIPNMPKTISPYGHVRKSMNESEEKKNSLNRTWQKTSDPTAMSVRIGDSNDRLRDNIGNELTDTKEKARQKLEAFYWQKLRELKQKEDDYLLKQSVNPSLNNSVSNYDSSLNYNYSVPPLLKANSLPREKNPAVESTYTTSSFLRGAPERRTDTSIRNKSYYTDADIIYRHPEKLHWIHNKTADLRGENPLQAVPEFRKHYDHRSLSLQPKRVSFEEQYDYEKKNTPLEKLPFSDDTRTRILNGRSNRMLMIPPRPPVRTTSVNKSNKIVYNHRIINPASASHSLYSESESGSEAGEIQRILHSSMRKRTNASPHPHFRSVVDDNEHSSSNNISRGLLFWMIDNICKMFTLGNDRIVEDSTTHGEPRRRSSRKLAKHAIEEEKVYMSFIGPGASISPAFGRRRCIRRARSTAASIADYPRACAAPHIYRATGHT